MKIQRPHHRLAALCALALAPACSNSGDGNVNIGNTQAVGAQLSDYVASWDGYAEAYAFMPDGSDRVRLTIVASGQGTVEFGNAALLPPPTDPNVGYPPSASAADQQGFMPALPEISEGFLYPIYAVQVQADRIQLGLNTADLYAAWCSLQTSFPYSQTIIASDGGHATLISGVSDAGVASTYYNCIPHEGAAWTTTGCSLDAQDGTMTPIDCGKLTLCWYMVCSCTATGCATPPIPAGTPVVNYPIELDGALDSTGTMLTGTLTLGGQRITVHLTKQL